MTEYDSCLSGRCWRLNPLDWDGKPPRGWWEDCRRSSRPVTSSGFHTPDKRLQSRNRWFSREIMLHSGHGNVHIIYSYYSVFTGQSHHGTILNSLENGWKCFFFFFSQSIFALQPPSFLKHPNLVKLGSEFLQKYWRQAVWRSTVKLGPLVLGFIFGATGSKNCFQTCLYLLLFYSDKSSFYMKFECERIKKQHDKSGKMTNTCVKGENPQQPQKWLVSVLLFSFFLVLFYSY